MITPLDIENKKFSRQMMNGYNVDEVDDFLDEITADYERLYKENNEAKEKVLNLESDINHYKTLESTLNNTLLMAQKTADEVKNVAKQQAEQIINDAQADARHSLTELEQQITLKQRELEEVIKKFDVYKAKMESLLISQLEMLKEVKQD